MSLQADIRRCACANSDIVTYSITSAIENTPDVTPSIFLHWRRLAPKQCLDFPEKTFEFDRLGVVVRAAGFHGQSFPIVGRALAVRAITGIGSVAGSCLSRRVASRPSNTGRLRSIRIRSGSSLFARSTPWPPSTAMDHREALGAPGAREHVAVHFVVFDQKQFRHRLSSPPTDGLRNRIAGRLVLPKRPAHDRHEVLSGQRALGNHVAHPAPKHFSLGYA